MTRQPIAHIPIDIAGHSYLALANRDTHYFRAYPWEL
ncbi:hypothetical protein SAMN05421509_11212 [Chromohalobacter canadensis]|uniref:Uncharacterized protein n=1 Tax=Chromohalobacter canadensis TaxID=141389 RepID=A0A285VVC1_9GAMM|nr:hypothetical protein SAMN05421509_11212 [Chromohalobacter canadensis]